MNHCLLEVEVLEAPQVRYTQDNQTPVAEMAVSVEGLRPDDPPGQIKVVGWGNLAQDLQSRVQVGQRLVVEGRLRMSTLPRPDGLKEKRAEFTLSRLHPLVSGAAAAVPSSRSQAPAPVRRPQGESPAEGSGAPASASQPAPASASQPAPASASQSASDVSPAPVWDTSPLVPDDDDIPF